MPNSGPSERRYPDFKDDTAAAECLRCSGARSAQTVVGTACKLVCRCVLSTGRQLHDRAGCVANVLGRGIDLCRRCGNALHVVRDELDTLSS